MVLFGEGDEAATAKRWRRAAEAALDAADRVAALVEEAEVQGCPQVEELRTVAAHFDRLGHDCALRWLGG